MPNIVSLHIKLARTAVGLGVRELATLASVAPSTIQRFESGRGSPHLRSLEKIQRALEDAGVIFILEDANGGPGVRIARTRAAGDT